MGRVLEVEHEAVGGRLDGRGDGYRAGAQLRLGPLDRYVQASPCFDAPDVERRAAADNEGVRRPVRSEREEGLGRRHADAAPLTGGVPPRAAVPTDLAALLVDDGAVGAPEALAFEEGAVVASGEEAGLLALGALGDGEAGRGGGGPGVLLRLGAEREADAVEQRGVDGREHVRLILAGVEASGDQAASIPLLDAGVVAGPEDVRTRPAGERDELVEAKAAVAPHARVRREAGGVPVDERPDDRVAERLPQVDGDVRQPQVVTRPAGGDDGVGEQHARSALGPAGSSQSRRVTPTASGRACRSATALSTPPLMATATRPGAGAARKAGPIAFASASAASVSPGTAAASSSVRPVRSRASPGASASAMRSPSTTSLTAAYSSPRAESPISSVRATGSG